ncbi:hypothetical protein [Prosthecobacter sp.]|uniref:hypothetical protein n=1 Tax=Prosthecobacter sp. TaxID=1965333 RepID=UPI001D76CBC7|nr:hypothetical protein [Prosthecobacter sp.]MCB1277985.1 hypothetical protein [Prosthecobacter sp.]
MTDNALKRIRKAGIAIVSAVSRRGVNEDRFRDVAAFAGTLAPTDRILMTDVRDVVVQLSIHQILDSLLAERPLACAGEGELYGDSPWNLENIKANFPDRVDEISRMEVFCAGVLAGQAKPFAAFAQAIWRQSIEALGFNGDQIAMNMVVRSDAFRDQTALFPAGNPHICHFGNLSGPDKVARRTHLKLEKGSLSDLHASRPVGVFHQYTRDKATRNATLMANGALRDFYLGKLITSLQQKVGLYPNWKPYWKS